MIGTRLSSTKSVFLQLNKFPIVKKKTTSPTVLTRMNHRVKYMQLVEHITLLIEKNKLRINDRLPSLNQLTKDLTMSKETVLKGLNHLVEKGIIEAEYRKGYYVKKKAQNHSYRICLILDKMNVLRDRLYHSFFETLKGTADIDIFFHHHNLSVFQKLVEENLNNYTHFAITTFFRESPAKILNAIPPHKRIILDYNEKNLQGDYTCIYQDFRADIFESLMTVRPHLKKYKRLVLIAPREAYHGTLVISGFKKFCKTYKYHHQIYDTVSETNFKRGDAYVTFSRYDQDDIAILRLVRKNNLKLGKDIGLLSYNDTAVKEILENGITVISTDFHRMGEEAARSILERKTVKFRDPAKIILRNSL